MATTKIEWTEASWNPVTGCTKESLGCKHCYAERMAKRLQAMGSPNYANGFSVATHAHALNIPLKWKKPCMVFVNSMGDLFHKDVSVDFIKDVFGVMQSASWHTFQVLTKRAERLAELAPELPWPRNVWAGVTVEHSDYRYRIDLLKTVPARTRFLSLEPLLGPIKALDLQSLHWVIVGGESGPGARPMDEAWVLDIRDQCIKQNVPFFFKQWGGVNKKKAGRLLHGVLWDGMPT